LEYVWLPAIEFSFMLMISRFGGFSSLQIATFENNYFWVTTWTRWRLKEINESSINTR
jgi:hypothetical protein